jgi:hypothetical protein
MTELERKNELDIVKIRGDLRLIAQKVDDLKTNDLRHLQKSIDSINRILWGVGIVVLGQLAVGVRALLVG